VLIAPSRVFLEKLTASQLVKKFHALYGKRRFIAAFKKAATCRYIEQCCMTVVRIGEGGGFSVFTSIRTKPDVIIHDMELQTCINISEYRAFAMCSLPEVQVFPKKLKQLATIQYVIT
jgi:hypothetical protein